MSSSAFDDLPKFIVVGLFVSQNIELHFEIE